MRYEIYTDGACAVNKCLGGYAAIVQNSKGERVVMSGSRTGATNNQMELLAVISGINAIYGLKQSDEVIVYSDSAYVVNAIQQKWYVNWIKNSWRTSDNKQVKNKKMWLALIGKLEMANITFRKVKGHNGVELNEFVDRMAVAEVNRLKALEG